MSKSYKVNVTFRGTASLEIAANTPDEARIKAGELELHDLARSGQVDIVSFHIAAREITLASALGGVFSDEEQEDEAPRKRPSGWYRPPA